MDLIIVRHGESEANVANLASGQLDSPLTEAGKQQAQELAKRLANHGIECIYSSPLKRTMGTAMPIAELLGKPINVDRRLIEVGFGGLEGKSATDTFKSTGKRIDLVKLLDTYSYDFSPTGGESAKQVEARVKSFLDDLKKQPYKKVLLVSHGGTIRWIHYLITGEKITRRPNGEELILKT